MKVSALHHSCADRRGMLLASLCFVHCVAGPVLLSFASLSSLIGVSEKLEPLFLFGSAAMGVITFVPAYRKKHRRKSAWRFFRCRFYCLLLRRRIELPAISIEPVATAVGAGLIIGAHVLNLQFSKRCQCLRSALRNGRTSRIFHSAPIRERNR